MAKTYIIFSTPTLKNIIQTINFTSNGTDFSSIQIDLDNRVIKYINSDSEITVYTGTSWILDSYRTVQFENAPTIGSQLDLWLIDNATPQAQTKTYEHIYKNDNPIIVDAAIRDGTGTRFEVKYATKQFVTDSIPTKVSQLENDAGYLTEHQSLQGYATEAWVENKHYLTEHQSLANYDTKEEVNTKISNATADMATQTWVENKHYLTQHQDISGKQDVIPDLQQIRDGAALGATAIQDVSDKVDKVEGKGLSTNDFTDQDKQNLDTHIVNTNNPHNVTASQIGLGNVNNTSDADKPISDATQTALDQKQGTLTAGDGITISASNVISATSIPSTLTQDFTAQVAIGKVTVGKVYPKGTALQQIIMDMLSVSTPVTSGKLYFAITDGVPSIAGFESPGANEQITSEDIAELAASYTHIYNNGESQIAQYYSIAYPTDMGTLISIVDGMGIEQISTFTQKTDGDYTIYYIPDQWIDVGMKFIFGFNIDE